MSTTEFTNADLRKRIQDHLNKEHTGQGLNYGMDKRTHYAAGGDGSGKGHLRQRVRNWLTKSGRPLTPSLHAVPRYGELRQRVRSRLAQQPSHHLYIGYKTARGLTPSLAHAYKMRKDNELWSGLLRPGQTKEGRLHLVT